MSILLHEMAEFVAREIAPMPVRSRDIRASVQLFAVAVPNLTLRSESPALPHR
jgi:hypothetical protein